MSYLVLGTIAFIVGAAAVTALWHRVWRRNVWPSVAAALTMATAAAAASYVSAGEGNQLFEFFVQIFLMALVVAMVVEYFVRRHRRANKTAG